MLTAKSPSASRCRKTPFSNCLWSDSVIANKTLSPSSHWQKCCSLCAKTKGCSKYQYVINATGARPMCTLHTSKATKLMVNIAIGNITLLCGQLLWLCVCRKEHACWWRWTILVDFFILNSNTHVHLQSDFGYMHAYTPLKTWLTFDGPQRKWRCRRRISFFQ